MRKLVMWLALFALGDSAGGEKRFEVTSGEVMRGDRRARMFLYVPVDASSAKMIMGYLALYKVAGDALYLEKARALGDTLVRLQKPNGYIPTEFWQPRHYADDDGGWPNCTSMTIRALLQLAEFDPPERR